MRVLRNLTLHRQGTEEVALAAHYGFVLRPEPDGVQVTFGAKGLEEASAQLAQTLAACLETGAAALMGGHTGVWIAALDHLAATGKPRPDLCYFDTRRERDEHGRFVFKPEGLVLLPAPLPQLGSDTKPTGE